MPYGVKRLLEVNETLMYLFPLTVCFNSLLLEELDSLTKSNREADDQQIESCDLQSIFTIIRNVPKLGSILGLGRDNIRTRTKK